MVSDSRYEAASASYGRGATLAQNLKVASITACYLGLNSSLNLLNKWALGNFFGFPLVLTSTHMLFSFLVLLPFMLFGKYKTIHAATLKQQWQGLVCIGLFMALNIALNNLSLVLISLSLNQVIRSGIPVATAILAVGIERKIPTRGEFLSLVVLTLGVMLAVWEGARGSFVGIAFALLGMLCNAAMMSTTGRVLSEKLEVLRLTFYTAPVSLLALMPFCLWREGPAFNEFMLTNSRTGIAVMLITSCNALAYNVVHTYMISLTSAVTTTVIGEAKIVGLLVLSALLLGEAKIFTFNMLLGCALALIGFAAFSHCKLAQRLAHTEKGSHQDLTVLTNGHGTNHVNGKDNPDPEKLALLNGGDVVARTGAAVSPHRRSTND